MDINEWQILLKDNFSSNDIVGGKYLIDVMQQEEDLGDQIVNKFHGFNVIADSFSDFFVDTLSHPIREAQKKSKWPDDDLYPAFFALYMTMFRTRRAADILLTKGYPLQGQVLQRV